MNVKQQMTLLSDSELDQVSGGGSDTGNDQNNRILGIDPRGLGGAMAGGAITGGMYAAAGGPFTVPVGAVGGACSFGMAYLANDYITRGGYVPPKPSYQPSNYAGPIGPLTPLPPKPTPAIQSCIR